MRNSFFLFLLFLLLTSCEKRRQEVKDDLLLKFGEEELCLQDVIESIPEGTSPEDSIALFNSIVESWVKDRVLSDFAVERLPDLERIERKVKDYRNTLIVQEYLTGMRESRPMQTDEVKVKEYYERHKNELKLEVPLVKGIFLKVNTSAKGRDGIKNMMSSSDLSSIDKLEQEWLDRALEYNYFRDKWIDWETLTSYIPYRFDNPETFLSENKYFETEYGECAYYLQISDYLPAGQPQPYEFAASWISNLLNQISLVDYEESLTNSLISNSIKEHKLETPGYDPITRQIKIR